MFQLPRIISRARFLILHEYYFVLGSVVITVKMMTRLFLIDSSLLSKEPRLLLLVSFEHKHKSFLDTGWDAEGSSCLQYTINWICYAWKIKSQRKVYGCSEWVRESRLGPLSLLSLFSCRCLNKAELKKKVISWLTCYCMVSDPATDAYYKKIKARNVNMPYEPGLDACHAFFDGGRVRNV